MFKKVDNNFAIILRNHAYLKICSETSLKSTSLNKFATPMHALLNTDHRTARTEDVEDAEKRRRRRKKKKNKKKKLGRR